MLDYILLAASTEAPKVYTWIASTVSVATFLAGLYMLYLHKRDDKRDEMTFNDDSLHKRLRMLEETLGKVLPELEDLHKDLGTMKKKLNHLETLQLAAISFIRAYTVWKEKLLTSPHTAKFLKDNPAPEVPDILRDLEDQD